MVFSPLSDFPSATDFKITLLDKVTKDAPKALQLYGTVSYNVHTTYLTLIGSTHWRAASNDATKIELQTDVKVQYSHKSQKAAGLLEATINGEKADFKIINTRPSKVLSIVFPNPKATMKLLK